MMDMFESCMVIEDQGYQSAFMDRIYVNKGQCLENSIGSVHQSYTRAEGGAVLFVLWSGCHATINIAKNVKHKRGFDNLSYDV